MKFGIIEEVFAVIEVFSQIIELLFGIIHLLFVSLSKYQKSHHIKFRDLLRQISADKRRQ